MRFLKTLTLNRRAIYDSRVALNTDNTFTVADSTAMVLPTSSSSLSTVQTEGMIRYNSSTHEVEVYQGSTATWRTLRFKEATKIVQQSLGDIDGYSYFYGPLNSVYDPTNISSNVPGSGGQSAGQFGGQNILVLIENVFQIYNTNYVITANPTAGLTTTADSNAGSTTLTFASTETIPTGSTVTGSPYLPANTIATVTDEFTVTLNNPVTGGNILTGHAITFTAPTGYYLNFTSDPDYLSMIGKPITVLLGFDK